MIRLENITIAYKNIVAVKDISLEIESGRIYGLVGPNGAGKSSLIKAMVGIISEYNGEIFYEDMLLQKNRHEVKKILGYAPENVELIPYLTGLEYLHMIADIRQLENAEEQILKYFSLLNMENKKSELINSYSHGMLQKISVAAAMIGMPKVLIFDEAFNGFDPISLYNLKDILENHTKSGGTIIISSHILELIEKWCSDIIIMNEGKILGVYGQKFIQNMKKDTGEDFSQFFVKLIQKNEID